MKDFFVSLCLILVAFGAAAFIKNGGALSKMTGFVFAVAVICSVIGTLDLSEVQDIKFNLDSEGIYASADLSSEAFKTAIENMLKTEGIDFEEIMLFSSKNSDGSINIEKIRVKGVTDKERTAEFIRENTGIEKIEVS
ncbi:MAG: hypothetical protein U0L72_01640 [Acutalibacteraceae bacterium]|nr:hypothetical protein [Acutalibacteraceae bacterium]